MARQGIGSDVSGTSAAADHDQTQELGSMYDYLAKIILLGPSGAGKSCLLHRFLRNEWRALTSQTVGVEFGSKIVAIGSGPRRTRLKLQLWDTAGTERFRSVSRSYYRGAAGALLVYDVASFASFGALPTFLKDARALGSPSLGVVLVGNKVDVNNGDVEREREDRREEIAQPRTRSPSLKSQGSANSFYQAGSFQQADSDVWGLNDEWDRETVRGVSLSTPAQTRSASGDTTPTQSSHRASSSGSVHSNSTIRYAMSGQNSATHAPQGREVEAFAASRWASTQQIPVFLEVSALSGERVEEAFTRLATMILTKIELGEIDPDDPQSGIQYGDGGWCAGGEDGVSMTSGTGTLRKRLGKSRAGTNAGLRDWEQVFRLDGSRSRKRGCC